MPSLQLERGGDVLFLDPLLDSPTGVQALAGVTGLGLPPRQVQFLEGAGDGARYRGRRILPRDIDLPIYVAGRDRPELKEEWARLVKMVTPDSPCRLRFIDDDSTSWWLDVVLAGGGDYVYGTDTTGDYDLQTYITLRAGDPIWTADSTHSQDITVAGEPVGLLPELVKLQLSESSVFGDLHLENRGDADAYPVWLVEGPIDEFGAVDRDGRTLIWTGDLGEGESLTINTRLGTVVDHTGANRYDGLAPAPNFWRVPPGLTECQVLATGAVAGKTKVRVTWRERKWAVI